MVVLTVLVVSCQNQMSLEQEVRRLPMDSTGSGCLDGTGVAALQAASEVPVVPVVDQEVQAVDRNCYRGSAGKSEVCPVVHQEVPAVLAEAETAEASVVALSVV